MLARMLQRLAAWWNQPPKPPLRDRVLEVLEGIDTPEKALPGRIIRVRAAGDCTVYSVLSRLREEGLVAVRFEYSPSVQMNSAFFWRTKVGSRKPVDLPSSPLLSPVPA